MKLYYNGTLMGEIITNHSLSIDDACKILGIDPSDPEEWDFELFTMEW